MAQLPKPAQILVQWFPSGLFGSLAVHSAVAGNMREAILSTAIAAGGSVWASYSKGFMDEMEAGANERGQRTAKQLLIATDTLPGKLKWTLSGFLGKYYNSLIDSHCELKTEGFNVGLPVLDLEEVFVPLQVAPEIPRNVPGGVVTRQPVPRTGEGETLQIWDFLRKSPKERGYRRIAILAPPGSGKTTLLQQVTLSYALNKHSKHKVPKWVPVLMRMRDVRPSLLQSQPPNLPELIRERVKQLPACKTLKPPAGYFEKLLQEGQCLVMLDGLDEVADVKERQRVSDWVNKQMRQYPQANFVLSSRPHGFEGERLDAVGIVLEVQPFNLQQIRQFVQSWYRQTEIRQRGGRNTDAVRDDAQEKANHLIQALLLNPAIRRLASNPLLVTMIATVHALGNALPKRRVELYREICDVLLGRRLYAKRLNLPLAAEQNQKILQVLALALMQQGQTTFELQAVEPLIQEQLAKTSGQTVTPRQWLTGIQEDVGLLVEKTIGSYEFAHLSFQEYLTAVQVKELNQEELLLQHFEDSFWAEVIRLYAAQSNVSNLIQQAIAKQNVQTLSLAYDCLEEGRDVNPEVRQNLEEILEAGLCSDNRGVAAMAATVKLSRRVNRLLEDDAGRAIDLSYLSQAEYHFLIHQADDSDNATALRLEMTPAEAQRPATPLEYTMVLKALTRLNQQKLPSEQQEDGCFYYYRLPTTEELSRYQVRDDDKLECWTEKGFDKGSQSQGIRIVREKIPKNYETLANYLAAGAWEEADDETLAVMLKVTNRKGDGYLDKGSIEMFPCDDLRVIDRLWVYYSSGRFGFSVQKRIYEEVGKDWRKFFDRVGWEITKRRREFMRKEADAPVGKLGHLPSVCDLSGCSSSSLFSRAATCKL